MCIEHNILLSFFECVLLWIHSIDICLTTCTERMDIFGDQNMFLVLFINILNLNLL